MFIMHMTFTRQIPPAAGMLALMAAAITIAAMSSLYLADYLIYPMQWLDMLIYEIEIMITSLSHLVGLHNGESFPRPFVLSRAVGVGIFAAALYIALEVFYVIALVFTATRQAVTSPAGATQPGNQAPKKLISAYMVLNMLYTLSFLYFGMFLMGFATNYSMAFSAILKADSIQQIVLASWPWRVVLFVAIQLLLLAALWKNLRWFKTAFLLYLLLDFSYYMALTLIPERGYGSNAGFVVGALALLLFLPYFRKK